jgi:hypothetical protein
LLILNTDLVNLDGSKQPGSSGSGTRRRHVITGSSGLSVDAQLLSTTAQAWGLRAMLSRLGPAGSGAGSPLTRTRPTGLDAEMQQHSADSRDPGGAFEAALGLATPLGQKPDGALAPGGPSGASATATAAAASADAPTAGGPQPPPVGVSLPYGLRNLLQMAPSSAPVSQTGRTAKKQVGKSRQL